MQTPEEFLESNGLATASLDREALIAAFQKEMEAGLAGGASSLKMIPTFTSPYGDIKKDTPVTVLDAGGTNLRGATVTIPTEGDIKIENKEKGEMPGAKSFVSEEDFYKVLTGHVDRCRPFAKAPAVGFCFSYPAEASADGDAKLLVWTKQIQAPAIVGQWVGSELAKRLDPKPSKIQVVNGDGFVDLYGFLTDDAQERNTQIAELKNLSFFSTGVDVRPDDQLLMLITCDGADDERFAVTARRLRDGETRENLAPQVRNSEQRR